MRKLTHSVTRPSPVNYRWNHIEDNNRASSFPRHDSNIVGHIHVYLAQLAALMGEVADEMWAVHPV
jgi:hypothetical protein